MDTYLALRFDDLCQNLGLDKATRTQAWSAFEQMTKVFTLEGDQLQWLICSIYDSGLRVRERRSSVSNQIPLVRLLRSAKERVHYTYPRLRLLRADRPEAEKWKCVLTQFFRILRKWSEMVTGNEDHKFDLRDKADKLERVFNVSTVVFKKLKTIFETVFAPMQPVSVKPSKREKKRRRTPCTSNDLFAFCWTLFVLVKGSYPGIGDDLVNTFHLLLCCVDWLYMDVLLGNRSDLVNPDFPLLPEGFGEECEVDADGSCIVEYLCQHYEGVVMEAKIIKVHRWRPALQKLVDKRILKGDGDMVSGVLDLGSFDVNMKSVNMAYEHYIVTTGGFDERVFLGKNTESRNKTLGAVVKIENELDEVDNNFVEIMGSPLGKKKPVSSNELLPRTSPLPPEILDLDTQRSKNLPKLLNLLKDLNPGPGDQMAMFLKNVCGSTINALVEQRLTQLVDLASSVFNNPLSLDDADSSKRKLDQTVTLYYKLLENIVVLEQERLKDKSDHIKELLKRDVFHHSLFACCLELVQFSHRCKTNFPLSLKALKLMPFEFYKIIEVVARCESGLWRAAVKHLNFMEENVLECLAWSEGSNFWEALAGDSHGVPTCEQVTYPDQLEKNENDVPSSPPLPRPELSTAASTKRRLFTTNMNCPGADRLLSAAKGLLPDVNNIENMNSAEVPKTFTFQTALSDDGRQILIPVTLVPIKKPDKPQRKGQLGIFFRKVYHLASVRLRELCERLQIEANLRGKIWTCFEYCLVKNIDLLKGRHLDQILLCSIYIVSRLSDDNFIQFQELVNCYRWQPQARSDVYRDVLLTNVESLDDSSETEERGDIVEFYNRLYVHRMKKFAMKFSHKSADDCPPISRLPIVRTTKKSPKKISKGHCIYVTSPIKEDSNPVVKTRAGSQLRYRFDDSTCRDLQYINRMIRMSKMERGKGRKRPLQEVQENQVEPEAKVMKEAETPREDISVTQGEVSVPVLQQKLLGLVRDRQRQEKV